MAEREELTGRKALLATALKTLSERERHILIERRLKDSPTTLEDLSQQYNISRERVRQIEVRASRSCKKSMKAQVAEQRQAVLVRVTERVIRRGRGKGRFGAPFFLGGAEAPRTKKAEGIPCLVLNRRGGHFFHPLMALLRLDRHRGDRPRLQPLEPDRLARLLAIAVGAVLDPQQRLVDLADQFAGAVAGAQFQRPVGFHAGAVGDVRFQDPAFAERGERAVRLLHQIRPASAAISAGNTRSASDL